jgi:hypothetical protein
VTCPKCNSEQPENARFCSQCAARLTGQGAEARPKANVWAVAAAMGLILLAVLIFGLQNFQRRELQRQAVLRAMHLPSQPSQTVFPTSHVVPIANGATTVRAVSYTWYPFFVPSGATGITVNGHFSAVGGAGNDIVCYILDNDGLANLKNGHQARAYFNSGKVTQATINVALSMSGVYNLVLDNRFSLLTPKAVQIDAVVSYTQ